MCIYNIYTISYQYIGSLISNDNKCIKIMTWWYRMCIPVDTCILILVPWVRLEKTFANLVNDIRRLNLLENMEWFSWHIQSLELVYWFNCWPRWVIINLCGSLVAYEGTCKWGSSTLYDPENDYISKTGKLSNSSNSPNIYMLWTLGFNWLKAYQLVSVES